MALLHFLLIYDHEQQKLVEALELGQQVAAAAEAYSQYEEKYRDRTGIEIVLVGADSLDTIRTTHAHYFGDGSALEPFGELLTH
ncbi:MAG TPA: hypothetical protein VJT75_11575 [Thermoleophilaceae bacterium]|nr:hypothetical protein [Thermoleophilaceae bacterium]